jgi:hypothetical protein
VVGDAGEVSAVGRKPEDAPTWTEVDRIGLFAVRCPVAEEEEGRSSLRSEGGGFSSAWLVEANTQAAAPAAGGTSGWFTSTTSGSGEQRNDVGGRARACEMAMVLAI